MALKLLAMILTLFFLVGCQPDTAGEVSSAGSTAPQSFDVAPVADDIFPATIVEDTQSNWIFLSFTDSDGDEPTSCQISNRVKVNVTTACSCSSGFCRLKVTGFANYVGPASFTYSVTTNNQTSVLASATFNISGISEAPLALDTNITLPESTVYTSDGISKAHLKGIDPDGDVVTCTKVTDPTNGVLTLNSDCSFVYTPTGGYEGTDSFTFNVDDGFFISLPATVSITVSKTNVPPVTFGSTDTIYQNVPLDMTLVATDADADPLIYYIIAAPTFGTLTGSNGVMTYTPNANFLGTDAFTFMVFDGTDNSNISTAIISVVTPTVFLRTTGNDATGVINDPALPFLTAQAAVDAVITYAPTSVRPMVIDVGTGSFGDITFTQDFGSFITWKGVSSATSIIGNIAATGTDGAAGVAAGDPEDGDYDGSPGSDGKNVFITSDYNIQFGNINASGGHGGAHAPDAVTFAARPGLPGAGGRLLLYGNFGTLTSRGGDGHAGGAGGDIALYNNSTSLAVNANGGLDLCTVLTSCPTTVASGQGGYVRVYTGAVVTGNVTANGGENNGVTLAGTTTTGPGGSVYVAGTVTGNVTTNGGNTYDATVGKGGNVTVDTIGIVGGNIDTRSGTNLNEGAGSSGGVVIVKGTAQDIYTNSFSYTGGKGGSVQIFGTVNNIFTHNTLISAEEGVDGGPVVIEVTGIVNDITTNAGSGLTQNGDPGRITVRGTVNGTISARGADSSNGSPGTGGNITVFGLATVNFVYATGGNFTGGPACGDGGPGGLITVSSTAIRDPLKLFVSGGNGSGCGNTGAAGTIAYP
jgi:hypothetical protein